MKKKKYQRMKNRLYNAIRDATYYRISRDDERREKEEYKEKAERFGKRIREIGANMKTVDPGSGKMVQMVKWELDPKEFGAYMRTIHDIHDPANLERFSEELIRGLVKGLMQEELVQMIIREPDFKNPDPLDIYGTIGAKIYVVPWEQMPHRRTIELKQYTDGWENE